MRCSKVIDNLINPLVSGHLEAVYYEFVAEYGHPDVLVVKGAGKLSHRVFVHSEGVDEKVGDCVGLQPTQFCCSLEVLKVGVLA